MLKLNKDEHRLEQTWNAWNVKAPEKPDFACDTIYSSSECDETFSIFDFSSEYHFFTCSNSIHIIRYL